MVSRQSSFVVSAFVDMLTIWEPRLSGLALLGVRRGGGVKAASAPRNFRFHTYRIYQARTTALVAVRAPFCGSAGADPVAASR